MTHPSLLAAQALADATQEDAETSERMRENAMVYATLAIADALDNISRSIEDLTRQIISVEVVK